MKALRLFRSLAAVAVLAGTLAVVPVAAKEPSGIWATEYMSKNLVLEKTTSQQVRALYGEPEITRSVSGGGVSETWFYREGEGAHKQQASGRDRFKNIARGLSKVVSGMPDAVQNKFHGTGASRALSAGHRAEYRLGQSQEGVQMIAGKDGAAERAQKSLMLSFENGLLQSYRSN